MKPSPAPTPFRRRCFLRSCAQGAGASLALPWLSSLPLRAEETGKQSTAEKELGNRPPVRFGCIYFSNGVEPAHWWAKPSGKQLALGPGLATLQGNSEEIIFIKGLFNEQAASHPSPHMGRMANREDLVGMVLFLLSDASAYCTGQNFIVDGGFTAW